MSWRRALLPKGLLLLLVWLVLVVPIAGCGDQGGGTEDTGEGVDTTHVVTTHVLVMRVIDGDTVEIEGGDRVRYIGMDTPEMPGEYLAREATEKNSELVEGKVVRLEKDVRDQDDYGRLLRYVWVDDTMVNAELVRLGLAWSRSYPPDVKHQDLLDRMQNEARRAGLGLWSGGG